MVHSKDIYKIKELYVCNLKEIEGLTEYSCDHRFVILRKQYDMNYDCDSRYETLYYEAITRTPITSYSGPKPINEEEHKEIMYNFEKIDPKNFTDRELRSGYINILRLLVIYSDLNKQKKRIRNR